MIQVAKITAQIAGYISGQISNDGIRLFNPVQTSDGIWIMDLKMAIDNQIPHQIITVTPVDDEM